MSTERPGRTRRSAILALRIVVSVAMLTVLIARIPTDDLGDLWPTWTASTVTWLLGAAVATGGAFWLAAVRWQEVAATLGVPTMTSRLLNHYLAGQFVGNFLPTDTECVTCHTGDLLRTTNHVGLGWVDRCDRCHLPTSWPQAEID